MGLPEHICGSLAAVHMLAWICVALLALPFVLGRLGGETSAASCGKNGCPRSYSRIARFLSDAYASQDIQSVIGSTMCGERLIMTMLVIRFVHIHYERDAMKGFWATEVNFKF